MGHYRSIMAPRARVRPPVFRLRCATSCVSARASQDFLLPLSHTMLLQGDKSTVPLERVSGQFFMGSALHVRLFAENLIRALLLFNELRSRHCQRALLRYHDPRRGARPACGFYTTRLRVAVSRNHTALSLGVRVCVVKS